MEFGFFCMTIWSFGVNDSQHVGAVGDQVAGLDEFVAELLDRGLVHREAGLVRQQLEEIGRRALQRDLERLIVDRLARRARPGCFSPLLIASAFTIGKMHVGIGSRGAGILDALEGEDEVARP